MNIALVTYNDNGYYNTSTQENEDDLLIKFLISKGCNVKRAIWNDPSVIWEQFDLAILKSPWDYFNLIKDFYQWLATLTQKKVKLLNPIATVKWNADKHYLKDIEDGGLAIAKCIFLEKGDEIELKDYFDKLEVKKLIVKPAVSGGSKNTFKVTPGNVDVINSQLAALLKDEAFILQPFLKEIEEDGEWSFVFFGGKFSHALLKKAKAGDFRVQHSFGGTIHPKQPTVDLLETAKKYVDQFAKDCLYARVDGVIVDNEFQLMELELIEPFLFLETNNDSFENYYQALVKTCKV
jgi:glutathione synthase/RimK-type ligase-like ATP-grasp enzyme